MQKLGGARHWRRVKKCGKVCKGEEAEGDTARRAETTTEGSGPLAPMMQGAATEEARKQGSKEARKHASKQVSQEARKHAGKQARKQGSKEARKQGSKQGRKQGSKEARKQASKQGSKEAATTTEGSLSNS